MLFFFSFVVVVVVVVPHSSVFLYYYHFFVSTTPFFFRWRRECKEEEWQGLCPIERNPLLLKFGKGPCPCNSATLPLFLFLWWLRLVYLTLLSASPLLLLLDFLLAESGEENWTKKESRGNEAAAAAGGKGLKPPCGLY